MTSFFKEYDIRGLIGEELNPEVALRIGKALGTFISGAEIVVGRIPAKGIRGEKDGPGSQRNGGDSKK